MIKIVSSLVIGMALFAPEASFATVPNDATTFATNVTTYSMNSTQNAKIERAEDHIKAVIGSDAFRTKVLNFTYNGKKQFNNSNGLTNAQIYQKILDASEAITPGKDNEMDLKIKVYYENSSTVGFTSTSSGYINMNTKFFNTYTPAQVARNMTHEWLHKLGFHHATLYSSSRDYSVPYAIGKIMEQLSATY
jgi:hypothetical protein